MCQSRKEDELNAGKIEIGTDRSLFDGLAILQETALCEEYMGKFPVIFISLKGVDGLSFANARNSRLTCPLRHAAEAAGHPGCVI